MREENFGLEEFKWAHVFVAANVEFFSFAHHDILSFCVIKKLEFESS